jgi:hypothetical protein
MCLLIAKPSGVALPEDWEEICENGMSANSDGSGFYTSGLLYKSVATRPKDFATKCRREISTKNPAIIHFRLATGGRTNQDNCHPFIVAGDGTAFAHNGILPNIFPATAELSDTAVLANSVSCADELISACNAMASYGNKFALIRKDFDDVIIIGDEYGNWDRGMWYSNNSYKRYNFSVTGFPRTEEDTETNIICDDIDTIALEQDVTDLLEGSSYNILDKFIFLCDSYGYDNVVAMVKFVEGLGYAPRN